MLRRATSADLDAVIHLARREEIAWFGAVESSDAELAEYLEFHGGVAAGAVVTSGNRITGFVLVAPSTEAVLLLDPGAPDPPLALLAAEVIARGGTQVEFSAVDTGRAAWFATAGWSHARSVFDLTRPGTAPVAPAPWPAGVRVSEYRGEAEAAAVHALVYVDAAYATVPGHVERDLPTWRQMFGPNSRGWIVRQHDRPIGWAIGRVQDDGRGWVHQLAVATAHRGTGLGRALLLHTCADLLAAGASSLGLNVVAANDKAIALYRSVGFDVDKEWRVYEPGSRA